MTVNVQPAMREWYEKHIATPAREAKAVKEVRAQRQAELNFRTPATNDDLRAIAALGKCRAGCGTKAKRFAASIQGETELSARQRAYLWSLVWTFRRQIADKELVKMAAELAKGKDKTQTPGQAGKE